MALLNHLTVIRMEKAKPLKSQCRVSVLIPLRNESARVSKLLESVSLIISESVEVILLNDESSDDTWAKLENHSNEKIRLIQGKPLPPGWVGKPWACAQLSNEATGDVLLFCDADVWMSEKAIERTVSLMEEHQADALTALPYQELPTPLEKAIVPFVMHLPIWGLLPLRWIFKWKSPSLLVANGQWFAIRKSAYVKVGGHESVFASLLEDMELGRKLVKEGFSLLPALATQDIRVRMYDSWPSMKEGFTKNLYLLCGGNGVGLAAVFGMSLWVYLGPLVLAMKEVSGAGIALLFLLLFRSITAVSFRVSPGSVWLHPLGALGFLYLLGGSWVTRLRGQVTWRGRQVQTAN